MPGSRVRVPPLLLCKSKKIIVLILGGRPLLGGFPGFRQAPWQDETSLRLAPARLVGRRLHFRLVPVLAGQHEGAVDAEGERRRLVAELPRTRFDTSTVGPR